MTTTRSLTVSSPTSKFEKTDVPLPEVKPNDVRIEISFSGICHSDIHQARNEWHEGIFPMVPGHEIAGLVVEVGAEVTKFIVGDRAGVGTMVDSCRVCEYCLNNEENYCVKGNVATYNGQHFDGTPTYGGYAKEIVVDQNYVLHIPEEIDLDVAAPLLCAGITLYSPLVRYQAGPGKKVAILGLGGLGHLGVKFAAAMGAEVTVLGHSETKRGDAIAFGAKDYVLTDTAFETHVAVFDFIINTTSADLDVDLLLSLLRPHGALVNVGLPGKRQTYDPFSIIAGEKSIAGINTGGIALTQQMLDFAAKNKIGSNIELVDAGNPSSIDAAYDRVVNSDVRYRFVIDAATI